MNTPPTIKDARDALIHLGPDALRNAPVVEWHPPANEKHEKNENSPPTEEDFSCNSSFSSQPKQRPRLAATALYGPAGEIIRRLEPVTEADPAAV